MSLSEILPLVQKPGRYLGQEHHAVYKDPGSVQLRAVLLFPDMYEIGMSHLGLGLLYHILNRREDIWAERAYAPALDFEAALRNRGQLLGSLESGTPLRAFDLVGVSLQYELSFTNLLTMLELGGIPWLAQTRGPQDPVVVAGGPICCNPEPVAPFFDAILVGEGEEAILEIADVVAQWRQSRASRLELYQELEQIPGVYVPSFFEMTHDDQGFLREIRPRGRHGRIRRRVVADLTAADLCPAPLVPQVQIVHDRLNVEISRGCTRGCRFCQAGMIYRPVRERAPEAVISWVEKALAASGVEEVSLLSLSTGDYGCLTPLLTNLMDRLEGRQIALSLPSMRADTLSPELMQQIKRVRKTGFTIAPEAGSARLRQAINKNLSETEILATVAQAFGLGWNLLKMYFMIGFPMEDREDLQALADLCHRALGAARQVSNKARLHVSINTFIPKPHTPFQWERQLSRGECQERLHLTKTLLKHKHIDIKWNPCDQSWLEGILSRGDRRLAPVVMAAQRLGCRFDAWTEHARLDLWRQALAACGIEADGYLRSRQEDELLPWDHLDVGVSKAFLQEERRRAWNAVQTPDCRTAGCQDCGVCDWVAVQPQLYSPDRELPASPPEPPTPAPRPTRYRLSYAKLNGAKWLSHLEFMNLFYRSLRRSGLQLHFSGGFHPLPRVSFHGALPVGVESLTESLDIELAQAYDPAAVAARLNQVLPPGIEVRQIEELTGGKGTPQPNRHLYRVQLPQPLFTPEEVENFFQSQEFPAVRKKPKETKTIDIRPLVEAIHLQDGANLEIITKTRQKDNLKISELLAAIFRLTPTDALQLLIIKQKSYVSQEVAA